MRMPVFSNSVWKENLSNVRNRCYIILFSGSFLSHKINVVKIFDSRFFCRIRYEARSLTGERIF